MGKKTQRAEKELLQLFGESKIKSKKLKKIIQKKLPELKKKYIKKGLRSLQEQGLVIKEGKSYKLTAKISNQDAKRNEVETLPFAEQIRRNAAKQTKKSVTFQEPKVDLDDEIRRLEQELYDESSTSSGEEIDSDECDSTEAGVLSLSELANDRIVALPKSCLPAPGKRSLKGIDNDYSSKDGNKKKKVKQSDIEPSPGLKAAVKEVLDGYVARSSERIPFYCRVCAKQYSSEEEFLEHKATEFHRTAVSMEKKATYCRLCRKQLTSPAQMKEHLRSRPHKERLQQVSQRGPRHNTKSRHSNRQWT